MKILLIILSWLFLLRPAFAQMPIHDEAIINQQERMVFASWDRKKFKPTSGFLGLNPMYWLTWGLHPNYPKTDLRPLGPAGPQTMRLGLIAAMSAAEDEHKSQSDTLAGVARSSMSVYLGALSPVDPMWLIYYKSALAPLDQSPSPLSGLSIKEADYMNSSGLSDWYINSHRALKERLELAKSTDMERGSRLLMYHRLLLEYRKLQAGWEDKKRGIKIYQRLSSKKENIKSRGSSITKKPSSDIELADQILKNSKL